jgi:uncharacterized protein with ATP-grasp and redox domains
VCILSTKKRVERKAKVKALMIKKVLLCIITTMSRHVIFKHFDVSSNYKTQKNDVYLIKNVQQPFKKIKNSTNSIANLFAMEYFAKTLTFLKNNFLKI